MKIAVAGGTGVAGRWTVDALRAGGHEAIVIARSAGTDLVTGEGLEAALAGVDAVIDATNVASAGKRVSSEFFQATARTLRRTAATAGVRHIVALSIVGIDRVPYGYYQGKLRREQVLQDSPVPVSILRAAQFHEFAGQYLAKAPGPVVMVPRWRAQPVAAREAGAALTRIAVGDPVAMSELAGPPPGPDAAIGPARADSILRKEACKMTSLRVAAVQANYVLMDRAATLARVAALTSAAAGQGAQLVAFPEVFVPGTPIWIDTRPIWDGDEDWFRLLAENAVVVPGPATERLGGIARNNGVWLVIGVEEREQHGGTIYNTVLYFSPDGALAGRHRKLVPTGSERTVWGMGDGSTLRVVDTPFGRVGGLICWENYMPLARFHMYAQGVDLWIAPTLAIGDGWIATLQHLARENRMFVAGVNPVLHADQIPADFPHRDRLVPPGYLEDNGPWLEEGNTVIIAPDGGILAGPVREKEETLIADLDLGAVLTGRRHMDPVGHYNRPDIFQLHVDTSPRPAFVEHGPATDPGTFPATSLGDRPE